MIATVYVLTTTAAITEGDAGITRRVVRRVAPDEASFKALVEKEFTANVSCQLWFGPISQDSWKRR